MATTIQQARTTLETSQRIQQIGFSEIAQVREAIDKLRQQGHKVFELHGGEPFFETPEAIKAAASQALAEGKTRYPASAGIAPLREALAKKLAARNHIPSSPEEIVVTNGGIQGLFSAFQTMLGPGDEVLVPSPYWTPIRDLILLSGAKPVTISTARAREHGWAQTLGEHATAATKLIYFNTPQNPSGIVISRAEIQEIADFAQERNFGVIADEAYEDLVYEGEHISIASMPGMAERTMTVFTFSKSYSMTGWRVGYTVGPSAWMGGMRKMALYTTTGVNTAAQWAALAALQSSPKDLAVRRGAFRERRELLIGGLRELGFEIESPGGAFYAFPKLSRLSPDSKAIADLLLQKARVSVVPGVVFGAEGEGHVRMTFSTSPEIIKGAIEAMRQVVR